MEQGEEPFRPMAHADCAAVVALVRELALAAGGRMVPLLDVDTLAANGLGTAALLQVTVAEIGGDVVGACIAYPIYSTWRAERGLYILDLVVSAALRGQGLGERLLRAAAARGTADGARFIKLEVDTLNPAAARFYKRAGFDLDANDQIYFLEGNGLRALVSRS